MNPNQAKRHAALLADAFRAEARVCRESGLLALAADLDRYARSVENGAAVLAARTVTKAVRR
jgi:hypothetical protein